MGWSNIHDSYWFDAFTGHQEISAYKKHGILTLLQLVLNKMLDKMMIDKEG